MGAGVGVNQCISLNYQLSECSTATFQFPFCDLCNLSLAQAALHTELEPAALKALLQEAQQLDYAEVTNDPKTGAVRYRFDV